MSLPVNKFLTVAFLVIFAALCGGEEIQASGVKGSYEQIQAKVIEVVKITDGGFSFIGYYIDYKGSKIMVSSMIGGVEYKAGESLGVMVQKMELPDGNGVHKMLQFMVMPEMNRGENAKTEELLKNIKEQSKKSDELEKENDEKIKKLKEEIDKADGKGDDKKLKEF